MLSLLSGAVRNSQNTRFCLLFIFQLMLENASFILLSCPLQMTLCHMYLKIQQERFAISTYPNIATTNGFEQVISHPERCDDMYPIMCPTKTLLVLRSVGDDWRFTSMLVSKCSSVVYFSSNNAFCDQMHNFTWKITFLQAFPRLHSLHLLVLASLCIRTYLVIFRMKPISSIIWHLVWRSSLFMKFFNRIVAIFHLTSH